MELTCPFTHRRIRTFHLDVLCVGYVYLEAPQALVPEAAEARGLRIHRHARAGAVHFHLLQRVRPA